MADTPMAETRIYPLAVDHLVALVPDLDRAGAAFAAAGFVTTPKAFHSAAMGTANICVMFPNAYLELMGIATETEANSGWRALLAKGAGLRGMAFDSPDIDATAADLAAAGITAEPVRHFSRMIPEGELKFSITRLPRAVTPGLQCLYCQHHTRDLLWQPQLMRHANGAGVILGAKLPDADALAALLALPQPGPTMPLEPGASTLILSRDAALPAPDAAALALILATSGLHIQFR